MRPLNLTEKIKRYALDEAGFHLVGISGAVLPEIHGQSPEKWVANGYAGSQDRGELGGIY